MIPGPIGPLLRVGVVLAFLTSLLPTATAQGPFEAGSALSFDGTVRHVDVGHQLAFNSYPFTLSAWIRTTDTSSQVRGIVSKYADGSFNGWSLFLYEGKVQAWYLTPAGRVIRFPLGLEGGAVADGAWHHLVFTVGPSGGKLYVDAALKDSVPWTNGAPTTPTALATEPLRIGRYHNYPQSFSGEIDEVTVWSRELDPNHVRHLGQRSPIGTELRLQGSWRFDNGSGNVLTDSAGFARHGNLINSPSWIASTAPVRRTDPAGDSWWNVLGKLESVSFNRTWVITGGESPSPAELNVSGLLTRFDDLNLPVTPVDVPVTFTVVVTDATDGTTVPLARDSFPQVVALDSYSSLLQTPVPRVVTGLLPLQPAAGLSAFLPGHSYTATVTMKHGEFDNSTLEDGTLATAATNLTVLSGRLSFGGINTTFTALSSAPTPTPGGITLVIPPGGAFIDGFPGHRFGGSFAASVDPVTNHATLLTGSVVVSGPPVDTDTLSGIRIRRGAITLGTGGATSTVIAYFPTGFGYTTSDQVRILEAFHSFPATALTQVLRPTNPQLTFTAAGDFFVCEESKPLLFRANGFVCDLATGVVRATSTGVVVSVRRKEVSDLAAAAGLPPGATKKMSNDAWLDTALSVSGTVEVRVGSKGDARLHASGISTTATTFATHHPRGANLSGGSASVTIVDDRFTSASTLPLTGPVAIPQGRDCFECIGSGLPIGPQTLTFNATGTALGITPDGGLIGNGALNAPTNISWGYRGPGAFAQTVHGVTAGTFMAPGFALRGDQSSASADNRAGVLLNTGNDPTAAGGLYPAERPGTPAYATGAASYGGFNFRVPTDGALLATCRLGDQVFANKPLRNCCKYYARSSGVSGLHQVQRGTIAGTFVIDGFKLQIDRYRLAYLSNENSDSGINGVLSVGGYSRFSQEFDKLFLNCFASMKRLQLPAVTVKKRLYYWDAEVRPLSMEFATGKECPPIVPEKKVLVLGCEAWVSHVAPTLPARLAIDPDGRLLPKKDLTAYLAEYPDLDSVLHLPGLVPLRGPQGSTYSLVPNTPAYFSRPTEPAPPDNPDPPAAAPNGFLHFAAKSDVSFFEDLKVHIHTSGLQNNTTSPLHIMGGWTTAGKTYWTQPDFDPDRAGVPPGVTKTVYRANNNPTYLVKATRNWKGIVKLIDCPVKWNRDARLFTTLDSCTTNLPILSVDTRINALGPSKTDLRFSKDFLPNFSLSNLAINELTEATGVITAFQNAGQAFARQTMQSGLDAMESMLKNEIRTLVEAPLNAAIDPFVDQLALSLNFRLNDTPPANAAALVAAFNDSFTDAGGALALRSQLQAALTAAGQADSLIGEIKARVVDGRAAAQSIRNILAKNPSGKRQVLPNLAEQLLKQFDSPVIAQLGAAAVRAALDVQIDDLEETFAALDETLGGLDTVFGNVITALNAAGNFTNEVKSRLSSIEAQILDTINLARTEIADRLNTFNVAAMNLSAPAGLANLKGEIRRILRERLGASRLTAEVQLVLRERMADVNDALNSAMDSVFQQVNDLVRGAISKAAAGLDTAFQQFAGGAAEGISKTGAAAKINGHAIILGDKLNCLRLDGDFKLSFMGENGAELELQAFLQVKDVSSRGGPGCGAGPGLELTEITIGAEQVKLGWKAGPNLIADLGVKFTLEGTQESAKPVNFAGYIKVTGGLNFAVVEINEIALAVAVGKIENYISAGARAKVSGWEFAGGFFAGNTCTLDPILLWATDAREVIGRDKNNPDQSFLGVYFYAEGWIPINELFGIPSTCLLTIKVGAGMGFFLDLAGSEPVIGAKFLLGLDGEIICILGINAKFTMIGTKRGLNFSTDGLRLIGKGSLCLEIGPCPFCIEICASLKIIYQDGSWDYDL